MLKVISLITLMALALPAMAFTLSVEDFDSFEPQSLLRPAPGSQCRDLKLTDAQKAEIHQTIFVAKKKGNILEAHLKNSKMDLFKVLVNPKSLRKDAEGAMGSISTKAAPLHALKSEVKLDILFDILTAEQRVKVVHCKKMQRRRGPKNGKGPHGRKGPRNGKGPHHGKGPHDGHKDHKRPHDGHKDHKDHKDHKGPHDGKDHKHYN
jgi:hypothetical protein